MRRKRQWSEEIEQEILRLRYGTLCDSANYNCSCESCTLVNTWSQHSAPMIETIPQEDSSCFVSGDLDRNLRNACFIRLKKRK